MSPRRDRSVEVALDLVGRTHARRPRIAAGLTKRPALTQQIPALVQLDFERTEPLMLLGLVDLTVLQLGPQLLLLGDQLVHLVENVLVLRHGFSVPDYGGCGDFHFRTEARDRVSRWPPTGRTGHQGPGCR